MSACQRRSRLHAFSHASSQADVFDVSKIRSMGKSVPAVLRPCPEGSPLQVRDPGWELPTPNPKWQLTIHL
eukprot:4771620-Pleurochrysis_carterae.AAC.1